MREPQELNYKLPPRDPTSVGTPSVEYIKAYAQYNAATAQNNMALALHRIADILEKDEDKRVISKAAVLFAQKVIE